MTENIHYYPEYIKDSETLLNTTFFDEKTSYQPEIAATEELGLRTIAYRACCRILAKERARDRAIARQQNRYDNTQDWNADWELSSRRLARIAFRHEHELSFLSRQLTLANQIDAYASEHWGTLTTHLDEDQKLYLKDIVQSFHKPSQIVTYTDGDSKAKAEVRGLLAKAPTAFGKSYLLEACTRVVIESDPTNRRRVLHVVPSLIIQGQLAKKLAQDFPDLSVGMLSADSHQPTADIVITTIPMFVKHFKNNSIDGYAVDLVAIDEVHHIVEPEFKRVLLNEWNGHTIGVTATDKYDDIRDARTILPHFTEHSTMLERIEEKKANDRQIFTFLIDQEVFDMLVEHYEYELNDVAKKEIIREVIDSLVIEFTTELLNEGRRGIVFCEAGEEARYADRLAERFLEVQLENGEYVRAESMHSYADNQASVREKYLANELDVITTVDTGREGFDIANIDFVIINCNIISRLRGIQIIGRGARVGDYFTTTIYAQFCNKLGSSLERLFNIEEAFGGKEFHQGGVSRTGVRKHESDDESEEPYLLEGAVDISQFSELIQNILARIDRRPIGHSFQGVRRGEWRVEEGMEPLREMLKGYTVNEKLAVKKLFQAGFSWRGKYETIDGKSRLAYYYHPEARAYIEENFPKVGMLTAEQAAAHFKVPLALIRQIVNDPENNIKGRRVIKGRGKRPICYDKEELEKIAVILKELPGIQPGDSTIQAQAQRFGVDETSIKKAAAPGDEKRYFINGRFPLTAAEVKRVEAVYDRPEAEPGEKYLIAIARAAGVDHQIISRNLSEEEYSLGTEKKYKDERGYVRVGRVWPRDISEQLVERMKQYQSRKLPAHLLPSTCLRRVIKRYGVTPSDDIADLIENGGFSFEEMIIEGSNALSRCLSWQAIAYLEEVMGKSSGQRAISIDYSRLPAGPDDLDPKKIKYAQQLQKRFQYLSKQLEEYTDTEPR